jgi:aminopeptidase
MSDLPEIDSHLVAKATQNVRDTVTIALEHNPSTHRALVIYDTENGLTRIITEAYRNVLPGAQFVDFNTHTKEEIIGLFGALSPRDLVVLIQSTDFRLNEFRIRIQLFQRKLKVIDHLHLYRNTPDSWETYINALAYDTEWYRGVGRRLKEKLEHTHTLRICGDGAELVVTGGLEIPKVNIGDYTGMENIGGTFPIGEVFTEACDLSKMNGSLMVYAYADTSFHTAMYEPFRITIKDGILTSWDESTPESFTHIVSQVLTNERALIREIGFGLNRAITRERYLKDITAFERIFGLHFSLGEKHTVYKKQGITPDKTRFHVDIFPVVTQVFADDELIFENDTLLV